jgi:solute carrier family 25 citrate transporter 1
MADPLDIPKYRNVGHAAYVIVKEEGLVALYKGVSLTALRQGFSHLRLTIFYHSKPCSLATNQAVNFTAYQEFKSILLAAQEIDTLPSYQHLVIGGISGAMGKLIIVLLLIFLTECFQGPLSNAPIDTIKTRIQRVNL